MPSQPCVKKGPQAQCFDTADEHGQQFFVAKQYLYKPNDSSERRAVYAYESYQTVHRFLKHYEKLPQEKRTYFELVRENRPCLEYYDIEWILVDNIDYALQEETVLTQLVEIRNLFTTKYPVDQTQCRVTSASCVEKKKGSIHIVVFGNHAFHNNNIDMSAFMKAFERFIEHSAVQPILGSIELKKIIDWTVYTRNRTMRCLGSVKCKDPTRPFVEATWHQPSMEAAPSEFYITNYNISEIKLVRLDTIPQVPRNQSNSISTRRAFTQHQLVRTAFGTQDQENVDSIKVGVMAVFRTSKKSKYMADQFEASAIEPANFGRIRIILTRIKSGPCILCDRTHNSDNAFLETNVVAGISFYCRRQPGRSEEIGKMSYSQRIIQRDLLIPAQEPDFTANEEYSEKFLKYCHVNKSLIIKSPTGTGKTRFLDRFITKNPHLIYIAVSCRRTLADELAKLPKFVNYMDMPGDLISGDRVVVQAESMWRLDRKYYEERQDRLVFIMDEFCSLAQQFTSLKTMGGHHQASATTFGLFQRRAYRVIALDADFTNSEVDLLRERRNDFHIIHNKHAIHDGDTIIFHATEEILLEETIQRLKNGQKLWIVSTNSAKHTEAIHKILEEKGNIGVCMTSNTLDADKRLIIKDIKSILNKNSYFIHTPTISVGIDYNIPDTVDCVVGFFNTQTEVTVETCRQMLRRARHIKTNTYLVQMSDKFNNLPITTHDVAEWLCTADCMIRSGPSSLPLVSSPSYTPNHVPYDDSDNFRLKLLDTYYSKVFVHVQTKINQSMNDFVGRFIQQMKGAGCTIKGVDDSDGDTSHYVDIKVHEETIASNINRKIASAPVVDLDQYEELLNRRGKTNASPYDDFAIQKYYLTHAYNLDPDHAITEEWVASYNSEKEIEIYSNLCAIRLGIEPGLSDLRATERASLDYFDRDEDLITKSIDRRANSQYVRLKIACDMLTMCGFGGPFSKENISDQILKSNFENKWKVIAPNIQLICTALKVRKPTYKAWTFRNKLYFVNSILGLVLGLKVAATDNKRRSYKIEHTSNVGSKGEITIQNIPCPLAS